MLSPEVWEASLWQRAAHPQLGSWSCGGRGWVSTHGLRVAFEGRGVWASEVWEAVVVAGCRRQHGVGAVQKLDSESHGFKAWLPGCWLVEATALCSASVSSSLKRVNVAESLALGWHQAGLSTHFCACYAALRDDVTGRRPEAHCSLNRGHGPGLAPWPRTAPRLLPPRARPGSVAPRGPSPPTPKPSPASRALGQGQSCWGPGRHPKANGCL